LDPDLPEGVLLVVEVVEVDDPDPDPDDGLGLGVVEAEVEVEVEVVLAGVVAVTVAAGVVAVTGGQDCETLTIGRATGSGSELGGVPGATFWKVKVWPPATVMTTVQPSADASGSAAKPKTTATEAMVTAATVSFRLVNTVACSSRGLPRAKSSQLRSQLGLFGRYKLPLCFAIRNRRVSLIGVRVRASWPGRFSGLGQAFLLNRQQPAATVALWPSDRRQLTLNSSLRVDSSEWISP
jgi:hypothetical protein